MSFAELVSSMYEAGVEPERWPRVVRVLAERFDARSMIMFSTPVAPERFSFIADHGTDPEWEALYNRHYTTGDVNPLAIAYRRLPVAQPNADRMIVPREQLRHSLCRGRARFILSSCRSLHSPTTSPGPGLGARLWPYSLPTRRLRPPTWSKASGAFTA
jgi:hypothetical protein